MGKIELKPRTKIDSKKRVIIPTLIYRQGNFKIGDIFECELYAQGKVLLTKLG